MNIVSRTDGIFNALMPGASRSASSRRKRASLPPKLQLYDMLLVAVGRSPNGNKIAAEKAGVAVTDRGFIPVDGQMRTNLPHIFAIGDLVCQSMLAHKAVHDAHVAADRPHPTLGESIGMAAEVYKGVCTDLPPARKR